MSSIQADVFVALGIGTSSLIMVVILMSVIRGIEMSPSKWVLFFAGIFFLLSIGFSLTPWAVISISELFFGGGCE